MFDKHDINRDNAGDMPVVKTTGKSTVDGKETDAAIFTFTNAAKEQLEALQEAFELDSDLEVIKMAIAFLLKIKEMEKKKDAHDSPR